MAFKEDIARLSTQITQRKDNCKGNEEATKHSLLLPFFQVMGYDTFDPLELIPEYKAGWASTKEKVDYAIFINGKPTFFVEAKAVGERLENHDPQLAKYFNSTPDMKVAVISDGLTYKFFTDLKQPNLMDPEPFFSFNMEALGNDDLDILQSFRRDSFNLEAVITKAEDLVYLNGISHKLRMNFKHPSEDFIRMVAGDVFPRKMTEKAVDRLRPLVRQAISSTLIEMVSQGLTQGINETEDEDDSQELEAESSGGKIITTQEELDVFAEISRVVATTIGGEHQITYKDTVNYFTVLADSRVSRWFCRTFLNPNVRRRAILIRLSLEKVKALVPDDVQLFEHTREKDPCTLIDYADMALIERLGPALAQAYREVLSF